MSRIVISSHATTYEGQDAILLVRAKSIRAALQLAKVGIRASRHIGPTGLLKAAGQITGKIYKRRAYDVAIEDLSQWIVAMMAALPIEKKE